MRAVDEQQRGRTRWRSALLWNLALAAGYAALGSASLLLVRETGVSAPVWPAAGLAVGAIFLRGPIVLPGIVVGSMAANLPGLAAGGYEVAAIQIALAIAVAAAVGAWAGATLARRLVGPHPALSGGREIVTFLGAAALLAAAVSATIGTAGQLIGGVVPQANAAIVWLTWWVGDASGITVLLPIMLMLSPGQAANWHGRRWQVAIPSLLVLAAVTVAGARNASLILEQRADLVQGRGADAAAALRTELATNEEVLAGLKLLGRSGVPLDTDSFRTFTTPILADHPEVQALSWNPIVNELERAGFVEQQRRSPGFEAFGITELADGGGMRPARTRTEYVPVTYIEPRAENSRAIGYDVASEPLRAAAIAKARATGTPQATAPITLVQGPTDELGILVFSPATNAGGTVDAFAVGVYRVGDLVRTTFAQPRWTEWNLRLADVTPGYAPTTLATLGAEGETAPPPGTPSAVKDIDVAGRDWQLVLWPTRETATSWPPATDAVLLVGGLAIVWLLEAFLLLLTGQERRSRRRAESSTFEATHDEVTGLLNRRGFFLNLNAVRDRVVTDQSTSVLMYCDLDHFKDVNDAIGHDAGDEVLRAVATAMQAAVRDRDTVARIGGDEFAVIVNNCDMEQARRVAEAVHASVHECTADLAGRMWDARMSIGMVPISGADAPGVDELLRAADAACYDAKRGGRDRIHVAP